MLTDTIDSTTDSSDHDERAKGSRWTVVDRSGNGRILRSSSIDQELKTDEYLDKMIQRIRETFSRYLDIFNSTAISPVSFDSREKFYLAKVVRAKTTNRAGTWRKFLDCIIKRKEATDAYSIFLRQIHIHRKLERQEKRERRKMYIIWSLHQQGFHLQYAPGKLHIRFLWNNAGRNFCLAYWPNKKNNRGNGEYATLPGGNSSRNGLEEVLESTRERKREERGER